MATVTESSPQALLAAATAVIDAYNSKDWDKARASIAPDFDYDEIATGRRVTGADATLEAWKGWARAFPDSVGTYRGTYATGDGIVVLEVTWSGTHTGPLQMPSGPLSPTGKSIQVPACVIFEVAGERATAQRHYFDMVTLLRQLGVMT
jgi:steroid delta-isomerase-like uncharacterized protein